MKKTSKNKNIFLNKSICFLMIEVSKHRLLYLVLCVFTRFIQGKGKFSAIDDSCIKSDFIIQSKLIRIKSNTASRIILF